MTYTSKPDQTSVRRLHRFTGVMVVFNACHWIKFTLIPVEQVLKRKLFMAEDELRCPSVPCRTELHQSLLFFTTVTFCQKNLQQMQVPFSSFNEISLKSPTRSPPCSILAAHTRYPVPSNHTTKLRQRGILLIKSCQTTVG